MVNCVDKVMRMAAFRKVAYYPKSNRLLRKSA